MLIEGVFDTVENLELPPYRLTIVAPNDEVVVEELVAVRLDTVSVPVVLTKCLDIVEVERLGCRCRRIGPCGHCLVTIVAGKEPLIGQIWPQRTGCQP